LRLRFGAAEAEILSISAQEIRCKTPPGAPGLVDVEILAQDRLGDRLEEAWLYLENQGPRADTLSPTQGPTAGGTLVEIRGRGFSEVEQVRFGELGVIPQELHEEWLHVISPAHPSAQVDVILVDRFGELAPLPEPFTFIAPEQPEIESLSPSWFREEGGRLTVEGRGFEGVLQISLAGIELELLSQSAQRLELNAPPHEAGRHLFLLRNQEGHEAQADLLYFENRAPEIISLEPDRGPLAGGTRVRLRGRHLLPEMSLYLGGQETELEALEGEDLILRSPRGLQPGWVDLEMETPDGYLGRREEAWLYLAEAPPAIHSLEPSEGPETGGTWVLLRGAHLRPGIKILLGGLPTTEQEILDSGSALFLTPAQPPGDASVELLSIEGTRLEGVEHFKFYPWPSWVGLRPPSLQGEILGLAWAPRAHEQLRAELGYSSLVEPDAWLWEPMEPLGLQGGLIAFKAQPELSPGDYRLCARFSLDGEHWRWADGDGAENGWSLEACPSFHQPSPLEQVEISPQEGPSRGGTQLRFSGLPEGSELSLEGEPIALQGRIWSTPPHAPGLVQLHLRLGEDERLISFEYFPVPERISWVQAEIETSKLEPRVRFELEVEAPGSQPQLQVELEGLPVEFGQLAPDRFWVEPLVQELGRYRLRAKISLDAQHWQEAPPAWLRITSPPAPQILSFAPQALPAAEGVFLQVQVEGEQPGTRFELGGERLWSDGERLLIPQDLLGEHKLQMINPDGQRHEVGPLLIYPWPEHLRLPKQDQGAHPGPIKLSLAVLEHDRLQAPSPGALAMLGIWEEEDWRWLRADYEGRDGEWDLYSHELELNEDLRYLFRFSLDSGGHWKQSAEGSVDLNLEGPLPQLLIPGSGSNAGGTLVELQGQGFAEGIRAWLGGQVLELEHLSEQQLRFITPAGQGIAILELETPDGARGELRGFRYQAPLQLSGPEQAFLDEGVLFEISQSHPQMLEDLEIGLGHLAEPESWRWYPTTANSEGGSSALLVPTELGALQVQLRDREGRARAEPLTLEVRQREGPEIWSLRPEALPSEGGRFRLEGRFEPGAWALLEQEPLQILNQGADWMEISLPPQEPASLMFWLSNPDGQRVGRSFEIFPLPLGPRLLEGERQILEGESLSLRAFAQADPRLRAELGLQSPEGWRWSAGELMGISEGLAHFSALFQAEEPGGLAWTFRFSLDGQRWREAALGWLEIEARDRAQLLGLRPALGPSGQWVEVLGEGLELEAGWLGGQALELSGGREGWSLLIPEGPGGLLDLELQQSDGERLRLEGAFERLTRPPEVRLLNAIDPLRLAAEAEGPWIELACENPEALLRARLADQLWPLPRVAEVRFGAPLPPLLEGDHHLEFEISIDGGAHWWSTGLGLNLEARLGPSFSSLSPEVLGPEGGWVVFVLGRALPSTQLFLEEEELQLIGEGEFRGFQAPARAPGAYSLRLEDERGSDHLQLFYAAQPEEVQLLEPIELEVELGQRVDGRLRGEGRCELGWGQSRHPALLDWSWSETGSFQAEAPGDYGLAVRCRFGEGAWRYGDLEGPGFSWAEAGRLRVRPWPPAQLLTLQPEEGPSRGGTLIQIMGMEFRAGDQLLFGEQPAEILSLEPQEIQALSPPGPPGELEISLVRQGATEAPGRLTFRYYPFPVEAEMEAPLSPILRLSEEVEVGAWLQLVGGTEGLEAELGLGRGEYIEEMEWRPIEEWEELEDGRLRFSALLSPREEGSLSFAWRFSLDAEHWLYVDGRRETPFRLEEAGVLLSLGEESPRLLSLSPAEGSSLGGERILVGGEGFRPGAQLRFGGIPARTEYLSERALEALSPAQEMGEVTISLEQEGGFAQLPEGFRYFRAIQGARALPPEHLRWNWGEEAPRLRAQAPLDLRAQLGFASVEGSWIWVGAEAEEGVWVAQPPQLPPGLYEVAWRFSFPGDPWTLVDLDGAENGYDPQLAVLLEVRPPPALRIERLSPEPGPSGAHKLELFGEGFLPGIRAEMGGEVLELGSQEERRLILEIPAQAPGRLEIRLENLEGERLEFGHEIYPEMDWGRLEAAAELSAEVGETLEIRGLLMARGTEGAGPLLGLEAELGYGPPGSHPEGLGWRWVSGRWLEQVGREDRYSASLQISRWGEYQLAYRFGSAGARGLLADRVAETGYRVEESSLLRLEPHVTGLSPSAAAATGAVELEIIGRGLDERLSLSLEGRALPFEVGTDRLRFSLRPPLMETTRQEIILELEGRDLPFVWFLPVGEVQLIDDELSAPLGPPGPRLRALVSILGLSEQPGVSPGLRAQLGLRRGEEIIWQEADYLEDREGSDLFEAEVRAEEAGDYEVFWRFSTAEEAGWFEFGEPPGELSLEREGLYISERYPRAFSATEGGVLEIRGRSLGAARAWLDGEALAILSQEEEELLIWLPAGPPGESLLRLESEEGEAEVPIERFLAEEPQLLEPVALEISLGSRSEWIYGRVRGELEHVELGFGRPGEALLEWSWEAGEWAGEEEGFKIYRGRLEPEESGHFLFAWRFGPDGESWIYGDRGQLPSYEADEAGRLNVLPRIDNIQPESASYEGGRLIEISGAGFRDGLELLLEGEAQALLELSPERLLFILPELEIRPPETQRRLSLSLMNPGVPALSLPLQIYVPLREARLRRAEVSLLRGEREQLLEVEIHLEGWTELAGPLQGLRAELGWGPWGSSAPQNPEWRWIEGAWLREEGALEIYGARLPEEEPGEYSFAWRLSTDPSPTPQWLWVDLDGAENGYQPEEAGRLLLGTRPEINAIAPGEAPLGEEVLLHIWGGGFEEVRVHLGAEEAEILEQSPEEIWVQGRCRERGLLNIQVSNSEGFEGLLEGALNCFELPESAQLEGPQSLRIYLGAEAPEVFAWVQAEEPLAQLGYGPQGSDPSRDPAWHWSPAELLSHEEGSARVRALLEPETRGFFQFCFRFGFDGEHWLYADLDGSQNGYSSLQAGRLAVEVQGPPPPYLERLTPQEGPSQGGSSLLLEGRDFEEGARLIWDGKPLESTYLDRRHIQLISPPGEAGPVALELLNPDGQVDLLESAFEYYPYADWCNLHWPADLALLPGEESEQIYGRARLEGLELGPEGEPWRAQLGYGPAAQPPDDEAWSWLEGEFLGYRGESVEFRARLLLEEPRPLRFLWRFSLDGGLHWCLGDLDGSGNGYQPEQAGEISLSPDLLPPTILSLDPPALSSRGGWLEIRGSGFQADTRLWFANEEALELEWLDETTLWARAGPLPPGPLELRLLSAGLNLSYSGLEIFPAPELLLFVWPPQSHSWLALPSPEIFGRIRAPHHTQAQGPAAGLRMELGWGPLQLPPQHPAWRWIPGEFQADLLDGEEYRAQIQAQYPGSFALAWRASLDQGLHWSYGDLDGGEFQLERCAELTVGTPPEITEISREPPFIEIYAAEEAEGFSLLGQPLPQMEAGDCILLPLFAEELELKFEGHTLSHLSLEISPSPAQSLSFQEGSWRPTSQPSPGDCAPQLCANARLDPEEEGIDCGGFCLEGCP